MLKRLVIRNYGIIADQELTFSNGLNIVTGETGAGKSIMLGALHLALGRRADTRMLFDKDSKLVVEATFGDVDDEINGILKEHDLDVETSLLMRREIATSGKSRAFINDTPVTLEVMQLISSYLIDLHEQFASLAIHNTNQQYAILDGFARNTSLAHDYREKYATYQILNRKIATLEADILQSKRERDFVEFELNELREAVPDEGVYNEWEEQFAFQDQAGEILSAVATAYEGLSNDENSIVTSIREILQQIERFGNVSEMLRQLTERLHSVTVEIEDISTALERISGDYNPDPALRDELEENINKVRRLFLKHGVQSIEGLHDLIDQLNSQFAHWATDEDALENAKLQAAEMESELNKIAAELSERRHANAELLASEVTGELVELEMKNARFHIAIENSGELGPHGLDRVEFLFAANLGGELMPVGKVASGGELSRLNLCIKSVVSQSVNLPTLVFDEIDAGVSGQVALKMGNLLKALSEDHQLIMVTHSPQIAARAQKHFKVAKKDLQDRSVAEIHELDQSEQIHEVAKMLSGDPPSEAAVLNAKQLIAI